MESIDRDLIDTVNCAEWCWDIDRRITRMERWNKVIRANFWQIAGISGSAGFVVGLLVGAFVVTA